MQSAVVASMSAFHRTIRTWDQKVDLYIALSQFSRQKFIQGGLPPEKIIVKPNFLFDPIPSQRTRVGDYALYLGRLSEEKGLETLLNAWSTINTIPLKIAGDGPLREMVRNYAQRYSSIEYVGFQDRPGVQELIRAARFVVVPSICYENFPMAILEAFANEISVICARLGAQEELIENGKTGLHFTAGDPKDLAAKVLWLWQNPEESERMGYNARKEYEQKYTAERNHKMLIDIYHRALESRV
jgi:glycosyltransferase involved in cell wall biosynthesis